MFGQWYPELAFAVCVVLRTGSLYCDCNFLRRCNHRVCYAVVKLPLRCGNGGGRCGSRRAVRLNDNRSVFKYPRKRESRKEEIHGGAEVDVADVYTYTFVRDMFSF